jgi:hypothetical protein
MKLSEANREHVDSILMSGAPLQELATLFPNREVLLSYHAQRMMEIFPPGRIVAQCECCNQRATEKLVSFQWRGIYHTAGTSISVAVGMLMAMGGGHGFMSYRQLKFVTSHGLCKPCYRRTLLKKFLADLVDKICFVFLLLSAAWTGGMLVFGVVVLASKPNTLEILTAVLYPCVGLIGLVVGFIVADRARVWGVPKRLGFIAKRPFQLLQVGKSAAS